MKTELSNCLGLAADDTLYVIHCPVCKAEVLIDREKYLFSNNVNSPSFSPSIWCTGRCEAHFLVAHGLAEILNTPKWPDPPKIGDKLPL